MKICPSCGNELNENAIVCVKCGTALPEKSEIKSSEALLLNCIKALKSGLIILIASYVIDLIRIQISFAWMLFYSIVEFLQFAGIVLMLVAVFQLSKYLSTKK